MPDLQRIQNIYIFKYYMTLPFPNVRMLLLKICQRSNSILEMYAYSFQQLYHITITHFMLNFNVTQHRSHEGIISNLSLCKQSDFISNLSK